MAIDPKDFLLYWLGAFVVLSLLLFMRPRRGGVRLRLLGGARAKGPPPAERPTQGPSAFAAGDGGAAPARRERPLNVIFQFNGHSWDAYEVLGVPAGSSYDTVKAAYLESLASVDPTSREFVESAFRAIDAASR